MSLKVGRLFGVEVRLHYTWFLIFAFLAWSLAWGYLPEGYPGPGDAAVDAFIKMAKAGVGRLPVVEGGKLVGIVTRSDFTRVIQERLKFRS